MYFYFYNIYKISFCDRRTKIAYHRAINTNWNTPALLSSTNSRETAININRNVIFTPLSLQNVPGNGRGGGKKRLLA